jgi:hypothetical protein
LIFGETRPPCNMTPEGPTQIALAEFRVIAEHIGTRDLVQEFLAFKVFPTMKEWAMPKLEEKEGRGAYSVALPLQIQETFQCALPRMAGHDRSNV